MNIEEFMVIFSLIFSSIAVIINIYCYYRSVKERKKDEKECERIKKIQGKLWNVLKQYPDLLGSKLYFKGKTLESTIVNEIEIVDCKIIINSEYNITLFDYYKVITNLIDYGSYMEKTEVKRDLTGLIRDVTNITKELTL